MPLNVRPWAEVRVGTGMTLLDWELLAVWNEVDPPGAGAFIRFLARRRVQVHNDWVRQRREWERDNPKRIKGGLSPLQENEVFIGG